MTTRAATLLARLRAERDAAVAMLRARREWLALWDEWSAHLAQGGDDPRDEQYERRLAALAARAGWEMEIRNQELGIGSALRILNS